LSLPALLTSQARRRASQALVGSRGNGSGGDVQVSAVGDMNRHCISNGWSVGITPIADVNC
jgi:hypothetical protein